MTTSITRTENINAEINISNMVTNLIKNTTTTSPSKRANADKVGDNVCYSGSNNNKYIDCGVNAVNNIKPVSRNANYEAMLLRNSIDNTLDVMLLIFPLCVILT